MKCFVFNANRLPITQGVREKQVFAKKNLILRIFKMN